MQSINRLSSSDSDRMRMARQIGAFAAGTLVCSLVLQRFAIPIGINGVDIVFPVGVLLAIIFVFQGALRIHRGRLTIFLLFATWLVFGACIQAIVPNSYAVGYSFSSVLQFLILTSFCILSFTIPVDEARFIRQAANILALIAIAGILQFIGQFVGLSLFSFAAFLPSRLLFEAGYNLAIPTGIGSSMKSNGFFLLEPSIFSQTMAMALILEILVAQRTTYLALFITALVVSFSGTGWLILASFLLTIGFSQGSRGFVIGLVATVSLVLLASGLMVLAPDVAQVFLNRINEINQSGTSGYLRFVTPFKLLHVVFSQNSWAWLTGIGAGVAERIDLPFSFGVNTPIKILVEYGFPGLLLYISLIMRAERTRLQHALILPSMTLLFITGGYQEFAPVLFPIFLLICVARLDEPESV